MAYVSVRINKYLMLSIQSTCRLLGCRLPGAVGAFMLYILFIDMEFSIDDQSVEEE